MKNTINSIIFVIVLTACSPGVPSELDARKHFENYCAKAELVGGTLKIDSFTKTNSRKSEALSGNVYDVGYEVTVIYLQSHNNNSIGDKRTMTGSFLFEKTEKGWESLGYDCTIGF